MYYADKYKNLDKYKNRIKKMEIDKQFSLRLKTALQRRNLRAADLARLIGTSDAKVFGWLHGRGLSVVNLIQIADALRVSLNWLIHGIGNEQLSQDGCLDPLEENLVLTLRHYDTETVAHINRFLACFRLASLNVSLKHFRGHDLISGMNLPFLLLDSSGKLLASNTSFNRLLGFTDEQSDHWVGDYYGKWLPRYLHVTVRNLMLETLTKGHAVALRVNLHISTNEKISYMARSRMLDTQDVNGVQIIFFPWED